MRDAPRFPRRGTPQSFGWLRTPVLDDGELEAWEQPNGVFCLVRRGAILIQWAPRVEPRILPACLGR